MVTETAHLKRMAKLEQENKELTILIEALQARLAEIERDLLPVMFVGGTKS